MTSNAGHGEPDAEGRPAWRWAEGSADTRSRRLDGWSEGYTADTTYLDEVNVDLCPSWLSMVSVLNGQPPLSTNAGFRWLDLACGTGLGACAVAAGNPEIEVWGVDYNPAHIERARHLAASAGLANCHFVEASLQQVASGSRLVPEQVDVIIVNGVYSWVSAANRRCIVEVIGSRLRPGGLASIMYEAASGWSSMPPLAECLRLLVDADDRPGDQAFHDAASCLVDLQRNGAQYFPIGTTETRQMESWATADGRYAAHEYLGGHFAPLLADDVIDALAGAKCSFIGGLGPLDHHPHYSMPPLLADLNGRIADPVTRELVRDLVLQRQLRRDLYRRGRAPSTSDEQRAWLHGLRIRGLGRSFVDDPIDLPALRVGLDPEFHVPLVEGLTVGDLDVEAILVIHPEWTLADAVTAIGLLIAGGYAVPVFAEGPVEAAVDSCARLNDVVQLERRLGRPLGCVASPATGAMLGLDLVEVLALDAIRAGMPADPAPLVEFVETTFTAHGRVVRDGGELVDDAGVARSVVERRVRTLLDRGQALRRLGVI